MLSKSMTCYTGMMVPSFSQPQLKWKKQCTQYMTILPCGLQMHIGSTHAKSKTEAMFFPSSLTQAESQKTLPKNFDLNNGNIHVQFTDKFNYLGWIITPCLTENAEIDARIKRATSQMGILRHYFSCKDVKLRVKYWVYITGPLNVLLWGSKSWNLSDQNQIKLCAFHHPAIHQILGIWMDEVIKCWIMNEQVRNWFGNIPPIDELIMRRTWRYIGKSL